MTGKRGAAPPGQTPGGWVLRPVTAARRGLLALAALVPAAGAVAALAGGRDTAVAVLLGGLVPVTVLLITWVAAEIGVRRSAAVFAALLLGSYVLKLLVVIGLLVALRGADLDRPVVAGISAITGLAVALVVEAVVVARTRAPYVDP